MGCVASALGRRRRPHPYPPPPNTAAVLELLTGLGAPPKVAIPVYDPSARPPIGPVPPSALLGRLSAFLPALAAANAASETDVRGAGDPEVTVAGASGRGGGGGGESGGGSGDVSAGEEGGEDRQEEGEGEEEGGKGREKGVVMEVGLGVVELRDAAAAAAAERAAGGAGPRLRRRDGGDADADTEAGSADAGAPPRRLVEEIATDGVAPTGDGDGADTSVGVGGDEG